MKKVYFLFISISAILYSCPSSPKDSNEKVETPYVKSEGVRIEGEGNVLIEDTIPYYIIPKSELINK